MADSARLAGKPPPPAPSFCASCLGHCQRVAALDRSDCLKTNWLEGAIFSPLWRKLCLDIKERVSKHVSYQSVINV